MREAKSEHELISALIDQLLVYVGLTPLEIVADAMLEYRIDLDIAKKLFGAYDEFVQMLSESESARS